MANPRDLIAAAERLETAQRGSNDFDADVYEAFGYEVIRTPRLTLRGGGPAWRWRGNGPLGFETRWVSQSRFTQSIDAARRLIPQPWRLETLSDHGNDRWAACLNIPAKWDCGTFGREPALALTAACLRAWAIRDKIGGQA